MWVNQKVLPSIPVALYDDLSYSFSLIHTTINKKKSKIFASTILGFRKTYDIGTIVFVVIRIIIIVALNLVIDLRRRRLAVLATDYDVRSQI